MSTATISTGAETRLHYMDNLRALAMLAGVVFHAGLAHSELMHGFWPTADAGRSVIVDVFAWFSHLFRMPLFFVVAGFFAALLVQKRGIGGMVGNRFARVLLPFIAFWPIVYFSMGWMVTHAVSHVENLPPLLAMIKQWMAVPNRPEPPPTLVHLWFLPYLMCFCVLVWVVTTLEWKSLGRWFASVRAGVLIGVAPLLLVPALFAVPAPHPAPESFLPQWWALLYYGVYFAFGHGVFHHPAVMDRVRPLAPWLLAAALAGYALFFHLILAPAVPTPQPVPHLIKAALEAYVGVWLTLCSLVYGKRWLDRSNRILRYTSEASYWVYLIHLPVLFAIQFVLLDVEVHWVVKFCLSLVSTLAVALVSYHLMVRKTVVGMVLNGTRRRENIATDTAPATRATA